MPGGARSTAARKGEIGQREMGAGLALHPGSLDTPRACQELTHTDGLAMPREA